MSDPLTKEEIDDLAERWYRALDKHALVEELHAMILDGQDNEMVWPPPESPTPALFGGFAGTTGPSDFPRSFISGLPPLAFPERPAR